MKSQSHSGVLWKHSRSPEKYLDELSNLRQQGVIAETIALCIRCSSVCVQQTVVAADSKATEDAFIHASEPFLIFGILRSLSLESTPNLCL